MRTLVTALLALAIVVALGACAPGPDAGGPTAVVEQALARLEAKDLDGLQALACEGQAHVLREQLGLPAGLGDELLPGLDTQALLEAVRFGVDGIEAGEAAIEGDVAQVPVRGTMKVTFDSTAMKPILRRVLEGQGASMTDEQLDALLATLEAYGQDLPVDESVRLVREQGAWRICQEGVGAQAAPTP